jgi:hypothetical protein
MGLPFYLKIPSSPPPLPHPPDPAPDLIPISDIATFAKSEAYYAHLAAEERHAKHCASSLAKRQSCASPYPCGFPSALMILSCFMWSMSVIGLMLKSMGFTWPAYALSAYFGIFKWFYTIPPSWFHCPPDKPSTFVSTKACQKKLLLLAVLAGLRKAQGLAHIAPTSECHLRLHVRRATRGHGHHRKLCISRLHTDDQASVFHAPSLCLIRSSIPAISCPPLLTQGPRIMRAAINQILSKACLRISHNH